jgi:hypothetical protein
MVGPQPRTRAGRFSPRYKLIGKRFARLVVTKRAKDYRPGLRRWLCVCDCGTEKVVTQASLISGNTKSCGCLHTEISRKRMRTFWKAYQKQRDVLYPE